jgi:regulatory protein
MGTSKRLVSDRQKTQQENKDALNKIYRYCAYQERSHNDVRSKLFEFGLRSTDVDEILSHLITEGFLNEERFARAFARGKFRILKWGKSKIQRELEASGVSPRNIKSGFEEIPFDEYSKALTALIRKKSIQIVEENSFKKKNKIARFAITKGYEPELVWDALNGMIL